MLGENSIDITQGAIVRNQFYSFSRKDIQKYISSGKKEISLLLPESFNELPFSLKLLKFPQHPRPEYILASNDTTKCITFSAINYSTDSEPLSEKIQKVQENMKRLNSSQKFEAIQELQIDENTVVIQEFSSVAMDDTVFNINYFTAIKDTLLIIGFMCPLRMKKDWKPVFTKIMGSIQINIK